MKRDWSKVAEVIESNNKFVFTTHINPDGDGLGSEIALAEYLRNVGKEVVIVNNSPLAHNYRFMDPDKEIIIYDKNEYAYLLEDADAFFILDISDWGRLKAVGEFIQNSGKPQVCIDHHHCPDGFSSLDFIDKTVSSTGELVYELLQYLNAEITPRMAEAIYTCILTDTGSFRFSNTTPRAHQIASELIQKGVNSHEIYRKVYEQNSRAKMKLLGMVLQKMKFECSGHLAWFNISKTMLDQSGASPWDTEGFADYPRSIQKVEVSVMFSELDPNRTKVSFRSKGRIAINSVAMMLGGGGHEFASGVLLDCSLKQANYIVIDEMNKLFE